MVQRQPATQAKGRATQKRSCGTSAGRGRPGCQLQGEHLQTGAQRAADAYGGPPRSRWSVCLCADHTYVFAPLTLTTAFWVSDITDFTLKMGKQVSRGREVTALGLS